MGVYNPKKKMPTSCYMCWDSLYCEYKIKNPVKMAQGRADDCPLIDIVPCKECKMWNKFEGGIWEEVEGEYGFCTLRVDAYKPFGEDNYCSYGERRTDDKNT